MPSGATGDRQSTLICWIGESANAPRVMASGLASARNCPVDLYRSPGTESRDRQKSPLRYINDECDLGRNVIDMA